MRLRFTAIVLASLIALPIVPADAQRATPRALKTPPGQVKIMSINARQNGVLGLKRFEDMYELSWAVRGRPQAFDGGLKGAVSAPDVITLQEVRTSNVEILVRLLRQRFKNKYQVAGFEDAASQIVYNPTTVTPVGDVVTWPDICSDRSPGRKDDRFYQFARFTENKSGAPFVVAGMHIPKNFFGSDQPECYFGNIDELRAQLEDETAPTFIAGDFNRRAVEQQHECDPDEKSATLQWHHMFTTPADGQRVYVDAVRSFHRQRGLPMRRQWTHEQKTKSSACQGSSLFRRARIDYIFSSGATVAEAGTDNPGWAGSTPGSKHTTHHKYSDHRFVWGRFIISGPARSKPPTLDHGRKGDVTLEWQPVEEATAYVIYRAVQGRSYAVLDKVSGDSATFTDTFTEHGVTYKYSVAAIGPDQGQGLESRHRKMTADARGPKIVSVYPSNGASGIDQKASVRIVFDERVVASSVSDDRIRLFRGTKRLPGTVRQVAPRVLVFDPSFPMRKRATHRVVTKPVQDRYGNVGGATRFTFTVGRPRR